LNGPIVRHSGARGASANWRDPAGSPCGGTGMNPEKFALVVGIAVFVGGSLGLVLHRIRRKHSNIADRREADIPGRVGGRHNWDRAEGASPDIRLSNLRPNRSLRALLPLPKCRHRTRTCWRSWARQSGHRCNGGSCGYTKEQEAGS